MPRYDKRQQLERALVEAMLAERHYYDDGVQYIPEFREVLFLDLVIAKRDLPGGPWKFMLHEFGDNMLSARQYIGAIVRAYGMGKGIRVQDNRAYLNGNPIKVGIWFSGNGTK